MRILNSLFLLIMCVFIVSCNSNTYKEYSYDIQNPDFSFLKEVLKDKKIVALGESSNGYGDLQLFKSEMIKYLHKEMGYDVLMMGGAYGDAKMAWENMKYSEEGVEIKENTLIGSLKSEELNSLFKHIKELSETENKLYYSGYDTQISGNAFKLRLNHTIKNVEIKSIRDSIKNGLESFGAIYQFRDSLEGFQYHKNRLFGAIDLATTVLNDNKEEIIEEEIISEAELQVELNTLDFLRKSVDYKFGETFTSGLALRDSLMAQFIIQQIKTDYPDKKIIIWGHNGRIEKTAAPGDNIKWMGHYLSEEYGDSYYALGMYCKKGGVYYPRNKITKPFDITEEGFIEKTLFDKNKGRVFVNLPDYQPNTKEWYNNLISGFEPEAGGKVSFIPSQRFDGVLLFPESDIPTFNVQSRR